MAYKSPPKIKKITSVSRQGQNMRSPRIGGPTVKVVPIKLSSENPEDQMDYEYNNGKSSEIQLGENFNESQPYTDFKTPQVSGSIKINQMFPNIMQPINQISASQDSVIKSFNPKNGHRSLKDEIIKKLIQVNFECLVKNYPSIEEQKKYQRS